MAPVVDRGGSPDACSMALSYRGQAYAVHALRDNSLVQAVSIGIGVVRGCGSKPQNVNLRSLLGISPADAVALEGDQTSIYVRHGVCPHMTGRTLVSCLKR